MKKQTNKSCLLCHSVDKRTSSIFSLLFNDDVLCDKCRSSFKYKPKVIKFKGIKVKSYYVYEGGFKDCLLQYKEAHDEALAPVFINRIKNKLKLRYFRYTFVLAPSSKEHIDERGFNHLEKILENSNIIYQKCFVKSQCIKQAHLSKEKRKEIKNSLKLVDKSNIPRKIVIFDDVLTTGNTMYSLYELIKSTKIKVVMISLSYNKLW